MAGSKKSRKAHRHALLVRLQLKPAEEHVVRIMHQSCGHPSDIASCRFSHRTRQWCSHCHQHDAAERFIVLS